MRPEILLLPIFLDSLCPIMPAHYYYFTHCGRTCQHTMHEAHTRRRGFNRASRHTVTSEVAVESELRFINSDRANDSIPDGAV